MQGQRVAESVLKPIVLREGFVGFDEWHGGIPRLGNHWHAEELAYKPEVYLEKVNPEQNQFGTLSALELWLELENEGYMRCGYGDPPRKQFELRLKSLSE